MFYNALLKMSIPPKSLERMDVSITGFSKEPFPIEGFITLLVIIGITP